jgi:hypothetical protein
VDASNGIETIREYRLNLSQKIQYLVLATFAFFVAGLFFKIAIIAGLFLKVAIDPIGLGFGLALGVIFLATGLAMVSLALRSRLILNGNRIQLRSALRTFNADRNELKGLRKTQNQYGRWIRLCFADERRDFSVSESFTGSQDFSEWLHGLPDLDQRDANQVTEEISGQDRSYGQEKAALDVLKQAKSWDIGLSIAVGVVSIPVLFVGSAPAYNACLAFLVLFTPLGIFLLHRFPLLFTIFKGKVDPRSDLAVLMILPGLAMMMSGQFANDPTHLVDNSKLLYWILPILLSYAAALFGPAWHHNSSRWPVLLGLLIFGAFYSIGLVNAVNTLADQSAPRPYRTKVLSKHIEHSSRFTNLYLHVAAWGPLDYSEDVSVPSSVYQHAAVGDPVCIGLHPGFLHARWYALMPCPRP